MKNRRTPKEGSSAPKKRLVWHTEVRKLAELVPYDKNPRTISKSQMAKLKRSIKTKGYHARIAITREGVIIAGHMRHTALTELKWVEAEVLVPNRELTEQEMDDINIQDNISFGEWDVQMLSRFEAAHLEDLGLTEKFEVVDKPVEVSFTVKPKKPMEVKCPHCQKTFDAHKHKHKEAVDE